MAIHELPGIYQNQDSGVVGTPSAKDTLEATRLKLTARLTGSLLEGVQEEPPGFTLGDDSYSGLGGLYRAFIELIGKKSTG